MQKDTEGGISGIMTEVVADDTLMGLDCVTENLYGGVSVVRCNISRAEAGLLVLDRERLQLSVGVALPSSRSSKPPPVSQLLPSGAVSDFFLLDQVCELKGGTTLRNAILQDGRRQQVNFYDAYACVCRRTRSLGDEQCDTFMRDGVPWVPTLSGSVGLYEQQDGDAGVYLVCCSSMPAVGSEVRGSVHVPCARVLDSCRLTRARVLSRSWCARSRRISCTRSARRTSARARKCGSCRTSTGGTGCASSSRQRRAST